MDVSQTAIDCISKFEGCKLKAYPDPGSGGDPWTIGFGATGPDIKRGLVWTDGQARDRLKADVNRFAKGVTGLIAGAPTTQGQFDAMVSLGFNIGLGNLGKSTLIQMHRNANYDGAAGQFSRWNKADGKVMAGLTNRRTAEARIYKGLPL